MTIDLRSHLTILSGEKQPQEIIDYGVRIIQSEWVEALHMHKLFHEQMRVSNMVETPFFVFVDGGPDKLPNYWLDLINQLIIRMEEEGTAIGYGDETINGRLALSGEFELNRFLKSFNQPHHSFVIRTSEFKSIDWPVGNFVYHVLVAGTLAQRGFTYIPEIMYNYIPSPNGSRNWPSTVRGIFNSLMYLQGKQGTHFSYETNR
jgi:hypothetical protein